MEQIYSGSYTLETISTVIDIVKRYVDKVAVITLTGDLGAGKTTLTRALLESLGVTSDIVSPTYTYVVTYRLPDGRIVHHFDLYRIATVDDFLQMGFGEYLYAPNALCIIEWPEVIKELLTHDLLDIRLTYRRHDRAIEMYYKQL